MVRASFYLLAIMGFSVSGALGADAVERAVASCWACHGAGAAPKDPTMPIIQGQQAAYLETQLDAFRSGKREDQIMSSMAESIPARENARAAAMIAALAWPKVAGAATAPAPDSAIACQSCHGADFTGGPGPEGVAPRLAGQFAQYLEARMGAFSRGEIASAATMTAMMKALDADERAKLAKYLSGL